MEERKNNSALYIIIIILVAVICLLVGFIFGKNLLSSDNNKNDDSSINENVSEKEDTNKEDKIVTLSVSEGKTYFDKVVVYNDYFIKSYSSNGIKSASNNDILYFLALELEGFGDNLNKNGFTASDLQKVANKYLTDDIKVNYTNILVPEYQEATIYKLGTNGKYTYNNELAMGGPGYYYMEEYYIDGYYNETKDEYTINTKLLYNQWCSDLCSRHDNYYSDSALNNVIYTNNSADYMELADVYKLVKDKLPTTSYTFVKNSSGNYVLSSVVVK